MRRAIETSRLAARERRLRMVMAILSGREAEYRRSREPALAGLQQSIAHLDEQLGDVRRRQAELATDR